ncbi:MAG: aminoacetone oxidase family FAD-binding enzyme [Lachnospiraceae bacterium]|nr:aminoacetone oxidase family FAD-binding enzyme [Lachnospiraceae bacterium]
MNIIIVGAGASGMTAAISAAQSGKNNKIFMIEHDDRVGKKILSTGNGKCNLTNENMSSDKYRCSDITVVDKVLNKFGYKETIDFFERLGLIFKNRDGYIYPYSGQASSVLDVLRMKCSELGVDILTGVKPLHIKVSNDSYIIEYIEDDKKKNIRADRLIIATGSPASNISGADNSGYKLIKELGIKVNNVLPALTGLRSSNSFCKAMAGVRCDGTVSLYVDNVFVSGDTGEIQLTDYGISGIPVFQVSRFASIALNEGKRVVAKIDFIPHLSTDELKTIFKNKQINCPQKSMDEQLIGVLNKKVAGVILKRYGNDIYKIIEGIKSFEFDIQATNPFEQSQIATGGIDVSQINFDTMESKKFKKLYFAGEIIDVDGICGGYNLQWAWATGYIAGRNAAK